MPERVQYYQPRENEKYPFLGEGTKESPLRPLPGFPAKWIGRLVWETGYETLAMGKPVYIDLGTYLFSVSFNFTSPQPPIIKIDFEGTLSERESFRLNQVQTIIEQASILDEGLYRRLLIRKSRTRSNNE